ncbi:TIGR03067 domain-containing protein [Stieleria mannarensis]|uniref:TIGR03067 domain-containing protein n=1 Tax=Stieleria mannarensis TaxID=2755585 RepID=UPI0016041E1B|nr:TIGR03067 domain-containing protein [Rhodopirellula sp. JC639]
MSVDASADDTADRQRLKGEWRVVALQSNGEEDLGASFKGMIWDFADKEYTLTPGSTTPAGLAGKRGVKVEYSLDGKQNPRHFTQKLGNRTLLGIYQFEDDQLKVCLARFGHDRPTKFDTKGMNDWLCYRLERFERNAETSGSKD